MVEVLYKGKNPAQVFNRFKCTIKESSTLEEEHIDEMFREQGYTGRNFASINLSNMTLDHTNFTDCNLTSANFAHSVLTHCNFTNTNLKFPDFVVGNLAGCTVE
jgi:uncharacterized protein YjbI with pentapeptide repeats